MTWVYIKSETRLWTVGFYRPDGNWEAESGYASAEAAAERVHYLNGGSDHKVDDALKRLEDTITDSNDKIDNAMVNAVKRLEDAISAAALYIK